MKSGIFLGLILLSLLASELRPSDAPERSVSPSGQFVIYGGDAAWRAAISKLTEQTKANVLTLLQRRDQWRIPAVINLQSRAPNVPEIPNVALRFSQTGAGLKLQLDLALSPQTNPDVVGREVLRVILLEMIYRTQTGMPSGETYVEPPDWLIDGLLALAPNRDRASLVGALATSEKAIPLEDFLRQRLKLLDSVGRSLYRAYSFALVGLLAENPAALGRYIDNLAFSSNDPLTDLQKSFPRLGSDFEKIWRTKVASIKVSTRHDLLSFSQSEEQLSTLLHRKFPAGNSRDESLSLQELCEKKLSLNQRLTLKKFGEDLILLAARTNPVLRPVIQDYQKLAAELALGKNHKVASKLRDLASLRAKLAARMSEVDDYMNWYEATQLQSRSGLFETLESSIDTTSTRPRRRDSFSVYLDAMEWQF